MFAITNGQLLHKLERRLIVGKSVTCAMRFVFIPAKSLLSRPTKFKCVANVAHSKIAANKTDKYSQVPNTREEGKLINIWKFSRPSKHKKYTLLYKFLLTCLYYSFRKRKKHLYSPPEISLWPSHLVEVSDFGTPHLLRHPLYLAPESMSGILKPCLIWSWFYFDNLVAKSLLKVVKLRQRRLHEQNHSIYILRLYPFNIFIGKFDDCNVKRLIFNRILTFSFLFTLPL